MSFYATNLDDKFPRIFAFGQEKAKKTWWAMKAAEKGFNVVVLDGDGGSHIAINLPTDARGRIGVVDLTQTNSNIPFPQFLAMFLRENNSFVWDLQDKRAVLGKKDPTHAHLLIDANKLTQNDWVVVDSHTAAAVDVRHQYAKDHRIDMTDGKKTEWDGYGFEGNFLTWYITRLKTLNCPVTVIGHETVYEKRAKDQKTILSQKTQPISSSGPHATTLGKNFTDILYFQRMSDAAFYIHTGGTEDRVGGGRLMKPQNMKWDDCPPWLFTEALGIKPDPNIKSEAFVYYAPGEIPDAVNSTPKIGLTPIMVSSIVTKPEAPKVLLAVPAEGTKPNPLAALMKK